MKYTIINKSSIELLTDIIKQLRIQINNGQYKRYIVQKELKRGEKGVGCGYALRS